MEVWPENWPVCMLFDDMGTQWRMGFGGAVGLDYGVLFQRMAQLGLAGEVWESMFEDIRLMEREALTFMNQES